MGLTKKKQRFIQVYFEDPSLNQSEIARKAGYSVKRAKVTGHELMRDPEILREIDRIKAAQMSAATGAIEVKAKTGEVSRESLSHECDEVIEQCTTAGAGAWQTQGRLKAIELKAKLNGLLTDKVEVGLNDKLMEILEGARKRSGLTALPPVPAIEGEMSAGAN
jgi:phage terminase small subunit